MESLSENSLETKVRKRVKEIINDFFDEAIGETFVGEDYEVKFNEYLRDNKEEIDRLGEIVLEEIQEEGYQEAGYGYDENVDDIGELIVDLMGTVELDDMYEWKSKAIKKENKKLQKSILEITKKQFHPFFKRTGSVVAQNIYKYANPYENSPKRKRKSPLKKRKSPLKKRKSPMKKRKSPMKKRKSPMKKRKSPMKKRK